MLLEVALGAGGYGLLLPGCCGCSLVLQLGVKILQQQQMEKTGTQEDKAGRMLGWFVVALSNNNTRQRKWTVWCGSFIDNTGRTVDGSTLFSIPVGACALPLLLLVTAQ